MDTKQFLADSPPTVVPLEIKKHFGELTDQEKRYAHHVSRCDGLTSSIYEFLADGLVGQHSWVHESHFNKSLPNQFQSTIS